MIMYEGQSEEKKSNIRRAEEGLYSRDKEETPIVGSLSKKEYNVKEEWSDESKEKDTDLVNAYTKKRQSMVKNILIGSLSFFIVALVLDRKSVV